MAIWGTLIGTTAGLLLGGPLGALAGAAAGGAADLALQNRASTTSASRRQVAFTIAAIALAAKMARADGIATDAEFATFQRLFQVPESERSNATRFYRLAQGSTAGFEAYADQAAALLGRGTPVLEDLLEALLLIAKTDGIHSDELAYLDSVAARLGFSPANYARIRARHLPSGDGIGREDPYAVLGLEPGAAPEAVRAAYRALVKTTHPDRHMADGTPLEFIKVAEARMAALNAAYAALIPRHTA
jgi:DnaJ like chaperone protein